MTFKPAGYSTVSPYLIVDGTDETIGFLNQVFDAVELRRFSDESGRITYAQVRIDDTVIMLGEQAEGWPAVGAHVHVYVPDVAATYQWALEAGATSVQEPVQKDDADKRGGIIGPGGTTWWIATKVS